MIEGYGLQDGVGAELGVFRGDTFFYLLDRFPKLRLYGIDTWEPGERDDDDGSRSYADFPLSEFEKHAREDARKYGGRAHLIRGDTAHAASLFPGERFDFVFIDADHTEEGVRRDIEAWRSKVKGFIAGHDIDMPSVKKAVSALLPGWKHAGEVVWVHA